MKTIIAFSLFLLGFLFFTACGDDLLTGGATDLTVANEVIETENDRLARIAEERRLFILDSLRRDSIQRIVILDSIFNMAACGQLMRPDDPNHMDAPRATGPTTSTMEQGVRCVSTPYQWELGVENIFLYDPRSDVFYLRAILDGNSLNSGAYALISAQQAPFRASISLENVAGTPSFTVDNPSLSSVREAVAEMLRNLDAAGTPAQMNLTIDRIHSESHAQVALRGSAHGFGARISANFNWNDSSIKTRLLVNFQQVYYSLDVDMTNREPSDFFRSDSLPDLDQLNGHMPVYVSSIKYGRQVVFSIESSKEEHEVRAAIQASYSRFGFGGSIGLETHHVETITSSSISAYVVGGSGQVAAENIGSEATMMNIFREGGNYSPESPGAPLSYTLRYLCDNSVAKIALASEYTVRECTEVGIERNLQPSFTSRIFDACPVLVHGDNEFGGPAVNISGTVSLEIVPGGREVKAVFDILYDEPINNDHPNDTRARIHEEIVAYELDDEEWEITGIIGDRVMAINYTPPFGTDGNFSPPFTGDFIRRIIMQADGGGDDLPCTGYSDNDDKRAHARFFFDDLKVNLLYR